MTTTCKSPLMDTVLLIWDLRFYEEIDIDPHAVCINRSSLVFYKSRHLQAALVNRAEPFAGCGPWSDASGHVLINGLDNQAIR